MSALDRDGHLGRKDARLAPFSVLLLILPIRCPVFHRQGKKIVEEFLQILAGPQARIEAPLQIIVSRDNKACCEDWYDPDTAHNEGLAGLLAERILNVLLSQRHIILQIRIIRLELQLSVEKRPFHLVLPR